MKFRVTLRHPTDSDKLQKAPEIYETYCTNTSDAIEEYCQRFYVNPSEILEFTPLVVSKNGPGIYGEGYYERNSYDDKPASAFQVHTVNPKKLINSLWRDANNRYLDFLYKIVDVRPMYSYLPNPYDTTQWEVEYVELNPVTMQIKKGDFLGIIDPTYKRMNLARFMHINYCVKMQK